MALDDTKFSELVNIGDIFFDIDNKWELGDVDMFHLVLSGDEGKDGLIYYECAEFMYVAKARYCGANIKKFLASELYKMKKISKLPVFPIWILLRKIKRWFK